jgi:predicted RNA-binding Zn-ribbon protein involved in translation (DUF1610 family)
MKMPEGVRKISEHLITYSSNLNAFYMIDHIEKRCPECGQQLRIPKNVGGVLMVCPSCGKKIHSDFRLGGVTRRVPRQNVLKDIFYLPYKIVSLIRNFLLRK